MAKPVAIDPAQTAHEVFSAVLSATESFALQDIGTDLAYLLGAIVDPAGEGFVDWSQEIRDEQPALLAILRERLPRDHAVWKHIVAGGK